MLFFLPLGSNVPYSKQPYVCYAILIFNLLIFILNWAAPFQHPSIFVYAPHDSGFASTIFCAFLHKDFLHLLFNMLLFYIVGFNVESKMGSLRFALFFVIAASFSSLVHGLSSDIRPLIGGSGAILAVMGAYLVLYAHASLNINFLPLTFLIIIFQFIMPPVSDPLIWSGIPPFLPAITLSVLITLLVIFDLIFFGLIFRIPMVVKSWPLFLIYFSYNLRMGWSLQTIGVSSTSFWAHCGGFVFGVGFAVLFYGLDGLFRDIDGVVVGNIPKFLQRKKTRNSSAIKSKQLGAEGGVAYEEDLDPRRLSIIAQLQSAVFSQRPLTVADLYDSGREEHQDLILAPGPQLNMGLLLQEGLRDDLAIEAWENLIATYRDVDETREARFLLARAYLKRPEDFEKVQPLIALLRKDEMLKREEVALDNLERELTARLERRAAGLETPQTEGPSAPEQDIVEEFSEIGELFDSVDQAWSVPLAEAGLKLPNTAAPREPDQTRAPPAKPSPPLKPGVPAKPSPPAKPEPSPKAAEEKKPTGEVKPPASEAIPAIGSCMLLVKPGHPVNFGVLAQALVEFMELSQEEAEQRLRRGKGILLKQAPATEAKELLQLIRAHGQDALIVPVQREFHSTPPENIITVQWSLETCTCSTYSQEYTLHWSQIRMIGAGVVKQQDIVFDEQRRVIDLLIKRPLKHFRLWDKMFNHRKSMLDEAPLLDASLDPLLPVLIERAPDAIKTKSLLKAVNSEELMPHEFNTLAEYDNYNLWFLYAHCTE